MKIEREELKNLRDALVNLMDFIDVVEQGELPCDRELLFELVRGVCYENAKRYFAFP